MRMAFFKAIFVSQASAQEGRSDLMLTKQVIVEKLNYWHYWIPKQH